MASLDIVTLAICRRRIRKVIQEMIDSGEIGTGGNECCCDNDKHYVEDESMVIIDNNPQNHFIDEELMIIQ